MLLGDLERNNLFLIPLDSRRQWFRYHHLFQELLQVRLAALEPELVPVLHKRAAAWYVDAGDIRLAMHHALASHDFDLAGKVFVEHWEALSITGQVATLAGWLDQLPESASAASPSLALAAAGVAAVAMRPPAEVERYLTLGSAGELDGRLPVDARSVRSAVALVRGGYLYDNVGPALAAAEVAVEEETDRGRRGHLIARSTLGKMLYLAGRVKHARRCRQCSMHPSRQCNRSIAFPPRPCSRWSASSLVSWLRPRRWLAGQRWRPSSWD